jgi:hypothetical protein
VFDNASSRAGPRTPISSPLRLRLRLAAALYLIGFSPDRKPAGALARASPLGSGTHGFTLGPCCPALKSAATASPRAMMTSPHACSAAEDAYYRSVLGGARALAVSRGALETRQPMCAVLLSASASRVGRAFGKASEIASLLTTLRSHLALST